MNARADRTVQAIRALRAVGLTAPRRRVPRQIPPRAIERQYAGELVAIVDRTRSALAPLLAELPHLVESAARERRTDAGETERMRALIERARRDMEGAIRQPELERLARTVADRTQRHNRQELARQVKSALGIDLFTTDRVLAAMMDHFVSENVALIKDLPAKIIGDVERTVTRGITSGLLHRELAKEIDGQFGLGEQRAKLIARDQTLKFYGQTNATRQKDLGITRFIWRTSNDRRVRGTPGGAYPKAKPSHYLRDGVTYSYDSPPEGGLPGEAILCRCTAEPDFSSIQGAAGLAPSRPAAPTAEPVVDERPDTQARFFRDGKWAPERVRIHDSYIAKVTDGVPKSDAPTAYMTGGGPASGKSSGLLENPGAKIPGHRTAAHIDPDGAKGVIPEYVRGVADGDEGAAALAHEESSDMAKRAVRAALDSGHDIVYDSVGDSGIEKLSKKVAEMRSAGATRVVANYATVDVEEAMRRATARAAATGRMVPEDVIRAAHADVSRTSVAAIERGLFDEFKLWDTTGKSPRLIATYDREAGLVVLDEDAWVAHVARGIE